MRPKAVLAASLLLALLAACAPAGAGSPGGSSAAPTSAPATAAPEGAAAPPTDAATGLTMPLPIPTRAAPLEPVIPLPSAVLNILGDLPYTYGPGECLAVEGDIYLNIPNQVNAPPPAASLIIWAGEGNIREGVLTWSVSEDPTGMATTTQTETIVIRLNADGLSGAFEGTARRATNGVPVSEVISVSGSFTCVAAPVRIAGQYPADLTGASCSAGPFQLRAGATGSSAVILITEGGAPGQTVLGAMTWRVDGRVFITTWLDVTLNPDGVSGQFEGRAIGQGVDEFEVSGTFNCLGL